MDIQPNTGLNTEPGTNPYEGTVYTGHAVIDEQGTHVGTVTDVIYDDTDVAPALDAEGATGLQPTWLVVDPGVLRAAHYMPVAGSYRTTDGTIVTPWDKDWVKSAIKASSDHVLTRDQREELVSHYSLAE